MSRWRQPTEDEWFNMTDEQRKRELFHAFDRAITWPLVAVTLIGVALVYAVITAALGAA